MPRPDRQAPRPILSPILLLLAAAACSPSQGGGPPAGGGPAYTGGPPGGVCAPAFQNEGCTTTSFQGTLRVRCDSTSSKWVLIKACKAGVETCVELPDPASPASMSKVSQCDKAFSSGDVVGAADGATPTQDAGDASGGVTPTDAGTLDAGGADGNTAPSPMLEATIDGQVVSNWVFTVSTTEPGPQQVFVRLSSVGKVPVILNKITLETENAFLKLQHDDGTENLPASLPPGEHAQLTIRYLPQGGQIDLAPGTLRVVPAHDPTAQVKIGFAIQQKKTGLLALCDDDGAPAFHFDGSKKGKVQRTCTVVNQTGAALGFDNWILIAKQPSQGAIVKAIYGLDAYVLDQDGQKLVKAPFTLDAGLKMVFAVTFYPPADGKVGDALLVAPWNQAGKKSQLTIPVQTKKPL